MIQNNNCKETLIQWFKNFSKDPFFNFNYSLINFFKKVTKMIFKKFKKENKFCLKYSQLIKKRLFFKGFIPAKKVKC